MKKVYNLMLENFIHRGAPNFFFIKNSIVTKVIWVLILNLQKDFCLLQNFNLLTTNVSHHIETRLICTANPGKANEGSAFLIKLLTIVYIYSKSIPFQAGFLAFGKNSSTVTVLSNVTGMLPFYEIGNFWMGNNSIILFLDLTSIMNN